MITYDKLLELGKSFNRENPDFISLSGADLSGADLRGVNLTQADLTRANLNEANLSGADLTRANLNEANLSGADLRWADLSGADLSEVSLRWANLTQADLRGVNLTQADLTRANLNEANLSGAVGLLDPIQYLKDNFEFEPDGSLLAYKSFGREFPPPASWRIEHGSILTEVCNPCRTTDCGCGINVAKLSWCNLFSVRGQLWKIRIRPLWLAGVVVPYNTDGKIRCSRCQLVEII